MKYPFNVYYTTIEDHSFWIAECPSLRGCVGQGETPEEALEELELNQDEWLKTAKEHGFSIPEVQSENFVEYSGKFTVRVAPYVHREAVEEAKKQGISLNQYVNNCIVAQNSSMKTARFIVPKIEEIISSFSSSSNSRQHYSTKSTLQLLYS